MGFWLTRSLLYKWLFNQQLCNIYQTYIEVIHVSESDKYPTASYVELSPLTNGSGGTSDILDTHKKLINRMRSFSCCLEITEHSIFCIKGIWIPE